MLVLQPSSGKLGSAAPYQCSTHQLPGCECTMNWCLAPLRRQNGAYMGIYGYMQPYIQIFRCIEHLKTYIYASCCIFLNGYLLLHACIYVDMCVYRCILACIWSCSTSLIVILCNLAHQTHCYKSFIIFLTLR